MARGQSPAEALGNEFLDVATTPGLLVLQGPSPLVAKEPAFQLFFPHQLMGDAMLEGVLDVATVRAAFDESLTSAWGVLGLLCPHNLSWLTRDDNLRRTLGAVITFWPDLDAVGARYTTGLPGGYSLWDAWGNLPFLLARSGVPEDVIRGPLGPGGVPALLHAAAVASGIA
jgi:hypothetical protein